MDWTKILTDIFIVIIIPLIGILVKYLVSFINKAAAAALAKTEDATAEKYIVMATNAVVQAVEYVAQTYVDALKVSGTFTKEAQIEAFNRAKDKALEILSEEAKNALNSIYGDFGIWLETRIEQTCRELKSYTPIVQCGTLLESSTDLTAVAATTAASVAATFAQTAKEQLVAELSPKTDTAAIE